LRPQRENDLTDLLNRLLDKGIILNADIIISVAGIPLIGVSLKAALASIETMLDYGMMEAWDESIREHYTEEFSQKSAPLIESEKICLKKFGSIWMDRGIILSWVPGFWYLTDKRLFLWREKMLFEAPLRRIEYITVDVEHRFNMERNILVLQYNGQNIRIHISDMSGFIEQFEKITEMKIKKLIPA